MRRKGKYLYRLDEVGKVILMGLHKHGRAKSLSQHLNEAGINFDSSRQVELAISLESLELIKNVSYRLPLEIRGELTPLGESLVVAILKTKKNKLNDALNTIRQRFGKDFEYVIEA